MERLVFINRFYELFDVNWVFCSDICVCFYPTEKFHLPVDDSSVVLSSLPYECTIYETPRVDVERY